jgi:ABC-type nitrate/sulfonate/bicarbonate transport system substrate-binding protein
MNHVSRRAFLGTMVGCAGALLAACGQAAPVSPSGNASAAKPAGSAAASSAGSAAKPAASPAASGAARLSTSGAFVALSASQMLLPLAKEAGYFDKYGLNFDLKYIAGSTTAIAAMVAGDVNFLNLGGTTVVNAVAGGAELSIVAVFLNKIMFRVMAMPEVMGGGSIMGKTVPMTRAGSTDFLAWQLIKAAQGWTDADLKLVPANDTKGQLSMLESGNAVAAALSPPNDLQAQRIGAHLITNVDEEGEKNTIAVPKKYAAEHRPEVLATLKGAIEAASRLKSDAAYSTQVMQKYLKENDQSVLQAGWQAQQPLWEERPYPNVPSFSQVIDEAALQNPKARNVTMADLLDPSFVKELDDSGFIRGIYGH